MFQIVQVTVLRMIQYRRQACRFTPEIRLYLVDRDLTEHTGMILFFLNVAATTEIYTNLNTLSLHDALPIFTLKPNSDKNIATFFKSDSSSFSQFNPIQSTFNPSSLKLSCFINSF